MSDPVESEERAAIRAVVHFGERQNGSSPEGYKESYDREACAELATDLGEHLTQEFAKASWEVRVSSRNNNVTIWHPIGSDL